MLCYNVYRPDPLYFAWKKAINNIATEFKISGRDKILNLLQNEWRCTTSKIHVSEASFITSVDLEFNEEKDLTMFLLRWS